MGNAIRETNLKNIISGNINFLMSLYGKTRKEVCADNDISYTTFCDWIKGNTYPRMDALEKLGYYFRVNTRDFFVEIETNEYLKGRLEVYAQKFGVAINSHNEVGPYTVADYNETPEGYPVELIRGFFHVFADSPTPSHQSVIMELCTEIGLYIKSKKGKCRVFPGPFDVELPTKSATVVVPDITVLCDLTKLTHKRCVGAPDWIIEVLSPSTKTKDMELKLSVYKESGVREYWMVDPDRKETHVYQLNETETEIFIYKNEKTYNFSEKIPVGIYPGYEICLGELDIYL